MATGTRDEHDSRSGSLETNLAEVGRQGLAGWSPLLQISGRRMPEDWKDSVTVMWPGEARISFNNSWGSLVDEREDVFSKQPALRQVLHAQIVLLRKTNFYPKLKPFFKG